MLRQVGVGPTLDRVGPGEDGPNNVVLDQGRDPLRLLDGTRAGGGKVFVSRDREAEEAMLVRDLLVRVYVM